MGSVERRLRHLEERATGDADYHGQSEPLKHLCAVLEQLAALKSSGARGMRGGVPIEPQDIPRQILGDDYTRADLLRLAVDRAVEAGKVPAERADSYREFILRMGERRRRGV